MFDFFRSLLPPQSPLRLFYHKMMAVLAALFYRFPSRSMVVIGVTGTKGKTTTCNMLHAIFSEAGREVGLLTTVNFKVGAHEEVNLTKQSTLSPFQLNRKLRQMADRGVEVLILEVTSHALVQNRIWGIQFDTAVFTNLAQDHLDYHETMEDYRNAKGRLFALLNASPRKPDQQKIAVINADDAEAAYFTQFPADQQFEYGILKGAYLGRNLESHANGTDFIFRIPNGEVSVHLPLPGRMNVYNALAAATVSVAHRIQLATIKTALEKMQPVPGRLELIQAGQAFTVVVDYAHTEEYLRQVLALFRELTPSGRLITVFGATGDRDRTKRPKMGAVVHQFSDLIVLTDDDPYTEEHRSIAREVRAGIPREEGDRFWQILDRCEAIRLALTLAKEGDTVVIAGKGAEAFQVVGKQHLPHDDRLVARDILSRTVDIELPI